MRNLQITYKITERADESINRYFQEIIRFPIISAEEEVELAARIRIGDDEALEKLVVSNLRFVVSVAKQYQYQGLSLTDLINEGNLGLLKAAKRFDEKRGFKFISYAVWWIRQAMIQAIAEQARIVRLPMNRISSINRIKKVIPLLEQEFEREPTEAEIADYLDIAFNDVKLANYYKPRQISFDMPLSPDSDKGINLYDLVHGEDFPQPDTGVLNESILINIDRALKKLTGREAAILIMSFGLCRTPSHTLQDIASHFDISCERVRQIRNSGLTKLKKLLKENYSFLEG
jgi:RNA polymerase primary sigma factor